MKNSPLRRKKPMRREESPSVYREAKPRADATPKPKKPKVCKNKACRQPFIASRMGQKVCGPLCAMVVGREQAQKDRDETARQDKANVRARKEAIKKLPQLHREAQRAVNAWIRLRDAKEPCISCNAPPPDLSELHAGRDAGHFRSVGSAPQLRYTPTNIAAQCVHCNQHLAGNHTGYRRGLAARIGLEAVEALENDNAPHKWTHEEVRAVRDDYRAKVREAKKARAT